MTDKHKEFIEKAEHAERMAAAAPDAYLRSSWADIARTWRALADNELRQKARETKD